MKDAHVDELRFDSDSEITKATVQAVTKLKQRIEKGSGHRGGNVGISFDIQPGDVDLPPALQNFRKMLHLHTSAELLVLPDVIETISPDDFRRCENLREFVVQASSCLRIIDGVQKCPLLERVSIGNSADVIGPEAFNECPLLRVVAFSRDSRMREIRGFQNCPSLECLELPPFVEVFSSCGRFFAIYGNDDFMRLARRRYHARSAGKRHYPEQKDPAKPSELAALGRPFTGKLFVLTGALQLMTRAKATAIIEKFGGSVGSSITKKTSVVVCGANSGAKLLKAQELEVEVWDEATFKDKCGLGD